MLLEQYKIQKSGVHCLNGGMSLKQSTSKIGSFGHGYHVGAGVLLSVEDDDLEERRGEERRGEVMVFSTIYN